jgi:aminocarboxymuconate-semialdehyde decarboxylase
VRAEAERNAAFAGANPRSLAMGEDLADGHPLERLPVMDAAGIDVSVLSLAPPAAVFADASAAADAFSGANDEFIAACAHAPDRFVVLAGLPLPHVEESIAELERLRAFPQVRGVCVGVDSVYHAPDRLDLDALLHVVEDAGYLFVVHPAGLESGPNSSLADFGLAPALGGMVWTSVVGLRLALSGALDRFPKLDVVVPHLGGVIPYLTQRLIDQTTSEAEHDVNHYITQRLYYDTCSFHPPALRCAVDTVGAERIMLGSDYPFRGELRRCVDDVSATDFSDEQKAILLGGTASHWFDPARG